MDMTRARQLGTTSARVGQQSSAATWIFTGSSGDASGAVHGWRALPGWLPVMCVLPAVSDSDYRVSSGGNNRAARRRCTEARLIPGLENR